MTERVALRVGTVKGVYGFESDGDRHAWSMGPPLLPEWRIDALLMDPDDPDHLLVGTSHEAWGATLRETHDAGETWTQIPLRSPEEPAEYPLRRIWQLVRGSESHTLYAGVEEAALYVSRDDGASWEELVGLTRHPSRPHWMPGNGGLCLHTILIDPEDPRRMWVGISAVGVFRTTDGGETWETLNAGLPPMKTTGSPDEDAAYCIHKMVLDESNTDRIFMQFHAHTMTPDGKRSSGVFRSDDGALTWKPIDRDLPLKFGFPMALSRQGELFVMPLISDENRVFDDGKPTMWRSENGGESWRRLDADATGEPVFSGVLRDAMALDTREPTGVYVGTTGGDVYASSDSGESWQRLPARLPRVLCVRAETYD
jgi:photosystem II stability/assembly factor-like uncharacterized protein